MHADGKKIKWHKIILFEYKLNFYSLFLFFVNYCISIHFYWYNLCKLLPVQTIMSQRTHLIRISPQISIVKWIGGETHTWMQAAPKLEYLVNHNLVSISSICSFGSLHFNPVMQISTFWRMIYFFTSLLVKRLK